MSENSTQETLIPVDPSAAGADGADSTRRKLLILLIILGVIIALLLGAFGWYVANRKPLSQLPIFSQELPPHYSTSWYQVSQPIDVAVDEANGRVYVSQSGGPAQVAVFDLEGNQVQLLGTPTKQKVPHLPSYIAIDPATKDVYVTDRAQSTVYIYDMSGNFLKEFRPLGDRKWSPLGIAFSADGNLVVSDVTPKRQRIWEFTTDGKTVKEMGAKDNLSFVNGMAFTPDGLLIAADSNSGRALVYNGGENALTALARGNADAPLGLPRGVAVDDRGRVYVVDTVNQTVRVYVPSDDETSPAPVYAFSFGEEGTGDGGFEFPNGVAVDSRGQVYVTDRVNNRVQVWSY